MIAKTYVLRLWRALRAIALRLRAIAGGHRPKLCTNNARVAQHVADAVAVQGRSSRL